jgi:hypothetical protein
MYNYLNTLRIAQEVIAIIKKFFTFKDKVTGETKEQDLTSTRRFIW